MENCDIEEPTPSGLPEPVCECGATYPEPCCCEWPAESIPLLDEEYNDAA